eukprot:TRINITY_DN8715_c0_g2_i2.p1 TRINITY_DN8715_c0_g2~~TRINITY_DN8715_c0_g2_i2.p1  ORF type:complete len:202 (-),score=19.44 TRINITY_DN8715_c0_g2_i2:362-967(-)
MCIRDRYQRRVRGPDNMPPRGFRFADTVTISRPRTNCTSKVDGTKDRPDAEWRAQLTEVQYQVLRLKDTDPRGFTAAKGGFDDHYDVGEYHCAGCETLLYTSRMKFDCGCGWPGFWDCVPGAVREHSDADGRRVEILCTACNGHLGHVFRGEGFDNPPPNERHCVNSTSLVFIKTEDSDSPGEDAASTELTSQTQTSDCGG